MRAVVSTVQRTASVTRVAAQVSGTRVFTIGVRPTIGIAGCEARTDEERAIAHPVITGTRRPVDRAVGARKVRWEDALRHDGSASADGLSGRRFE